MKLVCPVWLADLKAKHSSQPIEQIKLTPLLPFWLECRRPGQAPCILQRCDCCFDLVRLHSMTMSVSFIKPVHDAIVRFEETCYIVVSRTYLLQLHDGLGCTGSIEGQNIEWRIDVFLFLYKFVIAHNLCRENVEKLVAEGT